MGSLSCKGTGTISRIFDRDPNFENYPCRGFRRQALGFKVQRLDFRVYTVQSLVLRVQGLGTRVLFVLGCNGVRVRGLG